MLEPLHPNELCEQLAQTGPTIKELTVNLSLEEFRCRPDSGEWSITELVCHLRDVDQEVHLPRLHSLLVEEEPFMAGVVSDDWVVERNYQAQDPHAALAALTLARAELLGLLPLAESPIWQRRGRHTFFGPTSFLELCCLIFEHDDLHIQQVQATLSMLQAGE